MAKGQKVIPQKVVFDLDQKRYTEEMASFKKNILLNSSKNFDGANGSNLFVEAPIEGHVQLHTLAYPSGTNYTIGWFESRETNEGYEFVWNSGGEHFIKRIKGIDGSEAIVYKNACLNFQLDPKHFINETRCALVVIDKVDKVSGEIVKQAFLVFTDMHNEVFFFCVEDAIATNGFTGTYFDQGGYDPCDFITLGLKTPSTCISVENLPKREGDETKQNSLVNKGWQFRLKHVDVWGRPTEHGIISNRHFITFGSNCLQKSTGLPRCFKLTMDIGNPLVDKILIEYRNCTENEINLSTDSDWVLYDTVEKYKNCVDGESWWQRSIVNPWQEAYDAYEEANPEATEEEKEAAAYGLIKFNEEANTFEYVFCGDKGCSAISTNETSRIYNRIFKKVSSIIQLNKGIALLNGEIGEEPFACDVVAGVSLETESNVIQAEDCSLNELRKITVYATVYNPSRGGMGRIHALEENGKPFLYYFAYLDCNGFNPERGVQHFRPGYNNFIGYLAGTKYYAIGKQVWVVNGTELEFEDDIPPDANQSDNGDVVTLQKFEFFVAPGKYVFRIASHSVTTEDDYQKTSTFVVGHTDATTATDIGLLTDHKSKEIICNVCEEDFDAGYADVLMIQDHIRSVAVFMPLAPYKSGYVRESTETPLAMELQTLHNQTDAGGDQLGIVIKDTWYPIYTDHNGYFHIDGYTVYGTAAPGDPGSTDLDVGAFKISIGCGIKVNNRFQGLPEFKIHTWTIFQQSNYFGYKLTYADSYYDAYNKDADFVVAGGGKRREITGKLIDCNDNNVGIPGQPIVMKNGPVAFTDSDGEFKFVVHDRYDDFIAEGDTLILGRRGECNFVQCEDPCACYDDIAIEYKACGNMPDRNTTVATIEGQVLGVNLSGPQTGGRYQVGIVGWDRLSRPSFVQTSDKHFVDIPSLVEMGGFGFSKINFQIDPDTVFPSHVKEISFFISKNLNFEDMRMWVADKIELVDEGGNVNSAVPRYIRVYYESMKEYSKQNGFATNVPWDIVETGDGVTTIQGDWVEFIINGDNEWYGSVNKSLIRYDSEGKYFTIDFSEELRDLKEGALFRLVRPRTCETELLFYELCMMIPIDEDGKATINQGTLPYSDSYFLQRSVPVPSKIVIESPSEDEEDYVQDVNLVRYFPFLFEHPSPSDFWGDHCTSRGRVNTKNPNEKKTRYDQQIAPSKAILDTGAYNGLGQFYNEDVINIAEVGAGYITAGVIEVSRLLIICQHNSFVLPYADNSLRLDAEGRVIAGGTGSTSKFGTPLKLQGDENFGCLHEDVNTIRARSKRVVFLDRHREAFCLTDFSSIQNMAYKGLYNSWISDMIVQQNKANKEGRVIDHWFFHAGIDPKGNHVYLCNFFMPSPIADDEDPEAPIPVPVYFNTEITRNAAVPETAIIDLKTGELRCFASYTPEYLGALEGYFGGKNFFAFKNGVSWSCHNPSGAVPVIKFFGQQFGKLLRIIYNFKGEMMKDFRWTEVYCREHPFAATKVLTSKGQVSKIPLSRFQQRRDFFAADFLCDENTEFDPSTKDVIKINPLLDGDSLQGSWIEVTYESQGTDNQKYCEVSSLCAYAIPLEKSAD
jgi:hypothetical protein